MTMPKCIIDTLQTRTIEAQIVQKLKNNEARPKFTGLLKKNTACTAQNTLQWNYTLLVR